MKYQIGKSDVFVALLALGFLGAVRLLFFLGVCLMRLIGRI